MKQTPYIYGESDDNYIFTSGYKPNVVIGIERGGHIEGITLTLDKARALIIDIETCISYVENQQECEHTPQRRSYSNGDWFDVCTKCDYITDHYYNV